MSTKSLYPQFDIPWRFNILDLDTHETNSGLLYPTDLMTKVIEEANKKLPDMYGEFIQSSAELTDAKLNLARLAIQIIGFDIVPKNKFDQNDTRKSLSVAVRFLDTPNGKLCEQSAKDGLIALRPRGVGIISEEKIITFYELLAVDVYPSTMVSADYTQTVKM